MRIQEFVHAIKQRFALIDVVKNHEELAKTEGKKKKSDALELHNEIKIITSSDETFALWSELISAYAQGELIDVDSNPLKKYKDQRS